MSYRSERIAEAVGRLLGSVLGWLIATWALMSGLDEFDVSAPFWGCLLIVLAISTAARVGVKD